MPQEVIDVLTSNIDTLWVIDCAILVFIMQAGFMCMETGLSRHKNSINVALKNAADFGVLVVIFWIFGFGLMFGIFKSYVICICLFSLFNWFYPHKNWPIETEGTYSFEIIYKGSKFLVDEFPNSKDYYDETEEKLEKI